MSKCDIYYYTYHCVSSNIGHILLHDSVVNTNLWLIPLVIILVIVIFVISHVTFIITMTFIIIVKILIDL
jgi:hypothetical protein